MADDSARAVTSTKSRIPIGLRGESQAINDLKVDLQAIWAGANLRAGTTAIYVVDADSGKELYSVHAEEPMNPASNVKLISTGTVLATLGPDWRYQTELLGQPPNGEGIVNGSLYLHGNYDPTLGPGALTAMAKTLASQGVTQVNGDIVLSDSIRDVIATNRVRITVVGRRAGKAPLVDVWPATDSVVVRSKKVRTRKRGRSRVRMSRRLEESAVGPSVMHVDLRGNLRAGHKRVLYAKMPSRTSLTASTLRHAMTEAGILVNGGIRLATIEEFRSEATASGHLSWPLATHQSASVANLVKRVNKRSLNHLADRLVLSAARSVNGGPLNMGEAVTLMKSWLETIGVNSDAVVLDTGSGLSYQTRLTTRQIVRVLRAAGGYETTVSPSTETFRQSLAIGGIDGTLRRRFRHKDVTLNEDSHVQGKTGTLRKVIALSGFLAREDGRTLCFSIVTNGHPNHRKRLVRLEHEHLVLELDSFLDKGTQKPMRVQTASWIKGGLPPLF